MTTTTSQISDVVTSREIANQTTVRKYQFRDDFTWFNRQHAMKFGTSYISVRLGGRSLIKGYVGPGFGPPVGRPMTVVFGARFEF